MIGEDGWPDDYITPSCCNQVETEIQPEFSAGTRNASIRPRVKEES